MLQTALSYKTANDTVVQIPKENLITHLQTAYSTPVKSVENAVKEAIESPAGALPLRLLAKNAKDVLIISDDYTRLTPVDRIIPIIIDLLNDVGISDNQIRIIVAQGTHRAMTAPELEKKFGKPLLKRVPVLAHEFHDPNQLVFLGTTDNGTDIWVNKMVVNSDFVIGVGNILPHSYAGFSGGAKIIQPGVSGTLTTGQTHYLSVRLGQFLGNPNNPIRREMEAVADRAGLKFIVNTVMNMKNEVVAVVGGDHRSAFQVGVQVAREVFTVQFPRLADIVITDAYPHIYNLWQGGKALYSARMAVRKGGTIILIAACVEGFGDEPSFFELLQLEREEIIRRVDVGIEKDLFVATPAANVKEVCQECDVILVTDGIERKDVESVGFKYAKNLDTAIQMAFAKHGRKAKVITMANGADLIPVLVNEPVFT